MLLDRIRFLKEVGSLPEGMEISFDSAITLLVGANGCGKSAILDGIREWYGLPDETFLKRSLEGAIAVEGDAGSDQIRYFDFHGGDRKFSASFGSDVSSQFFAMRASSGTGLAYQFNRSGILQAKDSLILLDEPDRGMALNIQHLYGRIFTNLASQGNQIVASTHSWPMMELSTKPFCNLYSVEHQEYLSPEEFLHKHLSTITTIG